MSVNDTTRRVSATGTGAEQTVSFTFPIVNNSDITVYQREISTGDETVLTETTHYTVTNNGTRGGSITTVSPYISSSYQIHVVRDTGLAQETILPTGGDYSASDIEAAFDKIHRILIELNDDISRCIRIPETDASATTTELPNSVDRASDNITADSNGYITASDSVEEGSVSFTSFGTSIAEAANALSAKSTFNLDHVYDVRDYGAAGDGVTDDASAIQSAIEAAEADGGIVFFPPGTYLIQTTLSHDPDGSTTLPVHMVGVGCKASKIYSTATGNALTVGVAGTDVYGFGMHGLAFYGDASSGENGVELIQMHQWEISACWIYGFYGDGLTLTAAWNGVIHNFSHFGDATTQNTGSGIYATGNANGEVVTVTVKNCVIDWNKEWGIKWDSNSGQTSNVVVKENVIVANGLGGVHFHGCTGSEIAFNEVEANDKECSTDAGMGIQIDGTTYQCVAVEIHGNDIVNHTDSGTSNGGVGVHIGNSDSVAVHENRFASNDVGSIQTLTTAVNVQIGNNYLGDTTRYILGGIQGLNAAAENFLKNGSFVQWSSGSTSAPDSWTLERATCDKELTTVKLATQSVKLTSTTTHANLRQSLTTDQVNNYKGQVMSFGVWCYAPSTNTQTQAITILDSAGQTWSNDIPKDDAWHWIELRRTIDSTAPYIIAGIYVNKGSTSDSDDVLYVSCATLRLGNVVAPYTPHPAEALRNLYKDQAPNYVCVDNAVVCLDNEIVILDRS